MHAAFKRAPEGVLKAHMSTDKVMEIIPPVKTERLGEGHYKIDFGQEISGWARLMNIKGNVAERSILITSVSQPWVRIPTQ